jgi:uncharacterized coiled-coil DUF342 family protein
MGAQLAQTVGAAMNEHDQLIERMRQIAELRSELAEAYEAVRAVRDERDTARAELVKADASREGLHQKLDSEVPRRMKAEADLSALQVKVARSVELLEDEGASHRWRVRLARGALR